MARQIETPHGAAKRKGLISSTALASIPREISRESTRLHVTYSDPQQLKPRLKNPRTHSSKQLQQLGASIKEFGFITPVLVDRDDGIIAGHARVEAAKSLGMSSVPTLCVDHLNPAQIRAYVITDNRLSELANWDRQLLALELQELSVELNFDVTVTGFETAEVDILIGEPGGHTSEEADEIPTIDRTTPPVTRVGDRWRIGRHLVLCGDALKRQSYIKLLGTEKAGLIFTDPPFNVGISGHVSGLGKVRHPEFAMASGEMTTRQFRRFLRKALTHLVGFSSEGSIHFICMDWRHAHDLLEAAEGPYAELKNICVWAKTNGGMGSLYRSAHELIFVFKNGTAPHVNNVELGRFGRNRTNVWHYAGMNSFGKDRDAQLALHPTVKPVALIADAIMDCSKRGAIVLDSFAGSGSTLLAAENTGRRGFGIELDPYYVDSIIRRLSDVCGLKAVHEDSKLDFETISAQRLSRSGDPK